jgi:hypothetical protein
MDSTSEYYIRSSAEVPRRSSETSVISYRSKGRRILEYATLHSHHY